MGGTKGGDAPGDVAAASSHRRVQLRRERPNAMTAKKRQRFLDVLAATANVSRAAVAASATTGCFYRLRHRDASFDAAWRQAVEDGYAQLEARVLAAALGSGQPAGDPDRAGDVVDTEAAPFDVRLAIEVLKRRDTETRAAKPRGHAGGCRFVPIGDVERSLLAKLDAMDRRIAAGARRIPPA